MGKEGYRDMTLTQSWSGCYHVKVSGEYITYVWQFDGHAGRPDLTPLIGRWYINSHDQTQEGFATKEEAAAHAVKEAAS